MSSYKNNKDGTLTPIATNLRIDNQPTEQYVTEEELETTKINSVLHNTGAYLATGSNKKFGSKIIYYNNDRKTFYATTAHPTIYPSINYALMEWDVTNPYNMELKNKFAADCQLIMRADANLISYIEENGFTATEIELENAVRPAIEFFREKDCDVIILGCTHFLNIRHIFEKLALRHVQGTQTIQIVDSVDGVVRHALDIGEVRPQKDFIPCLFVTGESNSSYEIICSRYNIHFGGNI